MKPMPGHVAIVELPFTDMSGSKRRPVVVLTAAPTGNDDWLVCMVSTKIEHQNPKMDEMIEATDSDFSTSGLVKTSLVRIGRLAIVEQSLLRGNIGSIGADRLNRIKDKLKNWINSI